MTAKVIPVLLAAILVGALSFDAAAQESGQWSDNRVTFYAWGSRMEGEAGIASLPTLTVERSFSDTLSSLDFGAMAAYETRGERWGLLLDLQVVSVSENALVPTLGVPGLLRSELQGMMVAASYRLVSTDQAHFDLLAGLRYWSIETDASIQLPPGLTVPFPSAIRDSRSTTIAQLGAKGTWSFRNNWFLTGWAILGAGNSTDLAIDAMLAAGYNLSPRSSLMLGYRRIDLDYDSLRTDLDLTFRGPGLALDIRF